MAVEAIKTLTGHYTLENFQPFLSMYNGYSTISQSLRTFKMRGKKANCQVCGENPLISKQLIQTGSLDYDLFCGHLDYDVVSPEERISVSDYNQNILLNKIDHLLLDVRPHVHWNISSLKGSIHIPLDDLSKLITVEEFVERINNFNSTTETESKKLTADDITSRKIFCICRFGNDSRLATKLIKERFQLTDVWDIIGGLKQWSQDIDTTFPKYW